MKELDDQLRHRALLELNEDPLTVPSNLEHLRSKVIAITGLEARTDDAFLLWFLRARKHNVENAFILLKNYYKMRQQYPRHLGECLPSEQDFVYQQKGFTVLSEADQYGQAVIIIRVENVDLRVVSQEHFFQQLVTTLSICLLEPKFQIAGVAIIVDLTGFRLGFLRIVTPTFARVAVKILQDSFPIRVRAIHIVNEPIYFDAVFSLFKPLLKKKLRERIVLHGSSLESLHKHVVSRVLPTALGGQSGDWNFEEYRQRVLQKEHILREWQKYGFDRAKPDKY